MKKRIFQVLNFLAFNLLFFALYLNFIHKDREISSSAKTTAPATQQGTVLVTNPEAYLNKATARQTGVTAVPGRTEAPKVKNTVN